MLNTSPIDTPIDLGLRAIDVQVQPGRVGAEAGEQLLQSGRLACRVDDRSRPRSASASSPVSPRSSITILKPPAVPSPSTGGAPKTLTMAVADLRPAAPPASRAAMASAGQLGVARARGSRRASRTSRRSSGALAFSRIDWPAMATVCLTPGMSARRSARSAASTCCGALQRGRVGQLHVDQQIALVLRGNEARRASASKLQ